MVTCRACQHQNPDAGKFCSSCGSRLDAQEDATLDCGPSNIPGSDSLSFSCDPSPHGQFLSGMRVAGRYRIVYLAGKGGMGEVYRADDLRLGHPVALKFLPPDVAVGSLRYDRFLSEVRLSRQITHPNVCRVFDIGEVNGQHFLSMEYIDGEDLRSLLRRIGKLPVDKGVEIARQLCGGLAAAHEQGVLHRDLKPANVMIDGRGEARITDFGLACPDGGADGRAELAGTPAYMAPEQLLRGEATIRSDLYALGLILHELFTGQPGYRGQSLQELLAAHDASATEPRFELLDALDRPLRSVIRQCLSRDPSRRPPSARTVGEALASHTPRTSGSSNAEATSVDRPSLAVLPFVNLNADKENDFLSDGITEDLIMALSRLKGLRVPARSSSFVFKGKSEDIRRIGQLLDVETLLEGSVRRSGNRLRVTAQLVKAGDGFQLWSERYDREMKDVFDIQDDITRSIVNALEVELSGQPQVKLVKAQTASTEAYELCARGRVHWNQRGIGLKKALHYFELALLEDPKYSLAWSGLADAQTLLSFYDFGPADGTFARARTAAERAVSLDEQSAEAHCSLGFMLAYYGVDLPGSEHHFLRALELNSTYTPARYWYASILLAMERVDEALEQNRLAVLGDPLSKNAHAIRGWLCLSPQSYDQALDPLNRSLELDPSFPLGHWLLGRAYWLQGSVELALTALERAVELSGRASMCLSSLGWALALAGKPEPARRIQEELLERRDPAPTRPLYLAHLHAALGEHDQAFLALEEALRRRDFFLSYLPVRRAIIEPLVLEQDPRWPSLIARVRQAVHSSSPR